MNKQDFLKSVRQGRAKFRAENIVITTDSGPLQGKGLLEIADGRFRLHVGLAAGGPTPELPKGIKVRREFWLVEGMIEDEIRFSLRSLPSNFSRSYNFGIPDRSYLGFLAGRIELVPTGFECLTTQQSFEMQQRALGQAVMDPAPTSPQNVRVVFHAVLPNFKLIEKNGGTDTRTTNSFLGESSRSTSDTFSGEMAGWEYGLIEREEDLHVHFISKPEHHSEGDDHDWLLFQALLNALAFTHAQHAWPFSVEHRRDGKLITHRIQLNDGIAESPHAPFSEALSFHNGTKKLTWKFGEVLAKAFAYFSSGTTVAREVETVLFIFREATASGIPKRIALLSLCSLLESLVRVIYDEEIAPKNAVEVTEFQNVKKEICRELAGKKDQPACQRLAAIVSNADPINARMRFEAVVEHLGLKPRAAWQELFDLWGKFRNPMSHRMSKGEESEESFRDSMIAESRIAGAINSMILKLMNYSGYVLLSVYEDKYGQI